MEPLAKAATLLPPAAFRADPLVALTAFGRYIPQLLQVCKGSPSYVRSSWSGLHCPCHTLCLAASLVSISLSATLGSHIFRHACQDMWTLFVDICYDFSGVASHIWFERAKSCGNFCRLLSNTSTTLAALCVCRAEEASPSS